MAKPIKPQTTEGIAASNSTVIFKNSRVFAVANSAIKIAVPKERREIVKAVTDAFELEYTVFEGPLHIKEETSKISDAESFHLFTGCLKEMRKLSELVNLRGG